jgi:hypothetical protein
MYSLYTAQQDRHCGSFASLGKLDSASGGTRDKQKNASARQESGVGAHFWLYGAEREDHSGGQSNAARSCVAGLNKRKQRLGERTMKK